MKSSNPLSRCVNRRVLTACVLSFAILIMPFAQLAAATRGNQRSEARGQRSEDKATKNVATDNLFVNPLTAVPAPPLPGPRPEPAPQPLAPPVGSVTATMTAALTATRTMSTARPIRVTQSTIQPPSVTPPRQMRPDFLSTTSSIRIRRSCPGRLRAPPSVLISQSVRMRTRRRPLP